MPTTRKLVPTAVFWGIALFGAPGLTAQEKDGQFFDEVEVEVASVEVVVETAEGQKIAGLKAADFEIFENGVRQQITYFSALERGLTSLGAGQDSAGQDSAGAAGGGEAEERAHLAIVFDESHLSPANRQLILAELRSYLASALGGADLVLIARIADDLVVEQPFTADLGQIEKVLDRLAAGKAPKTLDADYKRLLRDVTAAQLASGDAPGSGFSAGGEQVAMNARAQAREILAFGKTRQRQIERSISSLGKAVASLAGLRGRKALIYLGDGLPMRATESLAEAWRDKYESWATRSGKRDLLEEMSRTRSLAAESQASLTRLAHAASTARIAFYALSPGSRIAAGLGAGEVVSSAGAGIAARAAAAEGFEGLFPLLQLADTTGGKAQTSSIAIGQLLGTVREDLGTYYSLGYKPSVAAKDGARKITVAVKRPEGAKVRHTQMLGEQDPLEELRQLTLATLYHGLADNPLGLELDAQAAAPAAKDRFYVDVLIKLPFERLLLLPRGDRHVGRLSLFVVVRDQRSQDLSTMSQVEIPIDVSSEQVATLMVQAATYPLKLEMRGGRQRLAIGLRDNLAQTLSATLIDLDVPASLEAAAATPSPPIPADAVPHPPTEGALRA